MDKHIIDIAFDFTSDSPHYWENFWENNHGLGGGSCDPDAWSPTLKKYHKILWSRELPNGQVMQLDDNVGKDYLRWNNFRFGSDSILASFRYEKYRNIIEAVEKDIPDYKKYMEDFLHRAYTIGGMIIFPKRQGGVNQSRGCNSFIKDRWDLTLECIRLYYLGEESPLYSVLEKDRDYFELFVDFRGYIDFFFLQDCVTDDYQEVIPWLGNELKFEYFPLPKSVDEYKKWISNELEFVEKRNKRIQQLINI